MRSDREWGQSYVAALRNSYRVRHPSMTRASLNPWLLGIGFFVSLCVFFGLVPLHYIYKYACHDEPMLQSLVVVPHQSCQGSLRARV